MTGNFGTIIQIGDILVSEDVVMEFFACDYTACKGACCIEGDSGAPMEERETALMERQYPAFSEAMSEAGRETVKANGFFEMDRDGDLVTPLIPGSGLCAFATLDDCGNCLCAIEKCGKTKPVSCSLYPIRVTNLTGGGKALNLHRWDICRHAFEKGRRDGTRVYEFLKKPLTDTFGEEFYTDLCAAAEHVLNSCQPQ